MDIERCHPEPNRSSFHNRGQWQNRTSPDDFSVWASNRSYSGYTASENKEKQQQR